MEEKTLNDFLEEQENFTYEEIEDLYEELLDECHDVIECGGSTFRAGEVLRALDPVTFRCGVADYSSEDFEEAE